MPQDDRPATPAAPVPLRVLLIEDCAADAELLIAEMRGGGYEPSCTRVASGPALAMALEHYQWDVITCDWVMPQFSGPAALQMIQEHRLDVPVIIVSGQVDEEVPVSAKKAGACDYVSKNRLTRLCAVLQRELRLRSQNSTGG